MTPSARRGEVITFYSYKGGVGRSAAVANVATQLAQRGHSVLAIDFDVEAPGLHRYFATPSSNSDTERYGTIDFFAELRARLGRITSADAEANAACFDEGSCAAQREAIANLLRDVRFIREVRVADPNYLGEPRSLFLMQAGRFDPSYPDRVRSFSWQAFYEDFPYFAELLAEELGKRFEYVLVDSRTGTTDVGNLCTVLLPEKLVLVFTPNEQSLHGALEVGEQAVELRKQSADCRPLPLFPLMSRVENAENDLQRRWISLARERFEQVFHRVYGVSSTLSEYFDLVQVPHRSFYAYGESIASTRERSLEVHSLASAFRVFTDILICNNAIEAQGALRARFEAAAPGVAPTTPHPAILRSPAVREPETVPDSSSPTFAADTSRLAARPLLFIALAVGLAVGGIGLLLVSKANMRSVEVANEAPAAANQGEASRSNWETRAMPLPDGPAWSIGSATATATTIQTSGSIRGARELASAFSRNDGARSNIPTARGASPEMAQNAVPSLPPSVDQALLQTLQVRARATPRGGQLPPVEKPLYDFKLWIQGPRDAVARIASVDYFVDNPAIVQKTLISTQPPEFSQQYSGRGCINSVRVTIRWKSKVISTLPFDQCAAL